MANDVEPLSPLQGLYSQQVVVTLAAGAVALLAFLWHRRRRRGDAGAAPDFGSFVFPEHQEFTLSSLAEYDGIRKPLCLGVCGKIVNCSSSENIKPGEGAYGRLWAGRDATYSLATVSLKPEDVNFFGFKLEELEASQQKALAGWYKHFTTKYPVVGTLKEYEGWDFSQVEKDAESETPFGARASPKAEATVTQVEQADGAAAAPAEPAEGMTLARGDRVTIQDSQDQPGLNGASGELQTFVGDKGRFAVKLDDGEVVLVRPGDLTK